MNQRKEKPTPHENLFVILAVVLIAVMVIGFSECCVCKPQPVQKDSVRIEYRDRVIYDTATVEVTKEVEKIVTRDTVSHLENTWASSDAMVSEGFLHHSLESKPRYIKVPVEVTVTDTLIIEHSATIIEKEVEKPLSWWQTTRIGAFWWLVGGIIISLVWIFRKPLLAILKNLLKI